MLTSPAQAEHVDSYYAATRTLHQQYPTLTEKIEVDTCIIGGGLAGIGTALPLVQAGQNVAVLEAARIGFGASGRNGGQVITSYACEMEFLHHQLGLETAQKMWQWSVDAVNLVEKQVQDYQIDCNWQRGYASVAVSPKKLDALLEYSEYMRQNYGYTGYQEQTRAQLKQHLKSDRYVGGVFDTDSGHIHPLNYCLGLAKAAAEHGVHIFEQSFVTDFQPQGDKWLIKTAQGEVLAKHVVLACNVFAGVLKQSEYLKTLSDKIMPVGTYVIATEPLGARSQDVITNNMAVCDTNFVLDYYRLSGDTRLLFGGKVSYSGQTPKDLANAMRSDMLRVFPHLADVKIDYAWGGFVDITMNRAPHFGQLAPNLTFLQGFSGHGVALTGLAGQMAAENILGNTERLNAFSRISHRSFPGGPVFRTPSLVLGMGWYRLKDCLQ
ncbi:FAD-dependent oxidoreductase [Vitreoscilla sp. C1]|uniref:NAD(P)/FAD-dependent oxidoreductase n=1 Tax=Vitreoscilla sp. (strain C1) TaxID=96942 RepID=UPI00148E9B00|nr:FAD-binding oxidoreductase [Vitreoscilla sp. C1]AUZ04662.2 FAD-dependent oxidoreductase [Vitreoscilla sp. C1]